VRAGGAFVLVDTASHRTVAAGMIRAAHEPAGA
jgi:sulfate adenylyltransferase subunit 1 (EFTu-like GTPase family)